MTRRQWTTEKVLEEIRRRRDRGLSLAATWSENPRLYAAAVRYLGSWRQALLAAGVETKPNRSWTRQSVLDAIRSRHARGLPLSRVWAEEKPLFQAAVRRFGNWGNALQAAGVQFRRRRKRWSRELVIAELRAWHCQSHEDLRAADPALAHAAARLFGTLDTALDAAGVTPKNRRRTTQQVIETIQDRFVRGLPLNMAGFGDKNLAALAKRRFGSWAEAVAAAGLAHKYTRPRRAPRTWTRDAVLAAIRTWHAEGRPLTVISRQDQGLYSAAKKLFGDWRSAVVAAGLKPARQQWTPDRVLEEIRLRYARGAALTSTRIFQDDPPLAGAGTRLFGTWREAVAAAGLSISASMKPGKRNTA